MIKLLITEGVFHMRQPSVKLSWSNQQCSLELISLVIDVTNA